MTVRSPVPPVLRTVATLLLALALSAGWAQEATVIGSIDATVNGEPRSWVQIVLPSDEGPTPLSSWSNVFMTVHDVTMQGFLEPRFMLRETIAVSLSLATGLPSDCPCTYDGGAASVTYLAEGSLSENLYLSDEGGAVRLTIDRFEPVEEGVYRLEGSFEATLPFRADVMSPPDLDDVVEIDGDFIVERLPEDATE